MRGVWAVAVSLCLAHPAWSLSCLRPDIARDYAITAASDNRFVIFKGNVVFDETALPKANAATFERPPAQTDITARFDGHTLTPEGVNHRFQHDVTLQVLCLSAWCGATQTGDHLAFLWKDDTGFTLELGPCGGMAYRNPTPEQLRTVTGCLRGEACEAADE